MSSFQYNQHQHHHQLHHYQQTSFNAEQHQHVQFQRQEQAQHLQQPVMNTYDSSYNTRSEADLLVSSFRSINISDSSRHSASSHNNTSCDSLSSGDWSKMKNKSYMNGLSSLSSVVIDSSRIQQNQTNIQPRESEMECTGDEWGFFM